MEYFENQRNPILPLKYHVPDSEAHVMPDGKLYLYGSFDRLDRIYCSTEYHPVSTADMRHWCIHDTSFTGDAVPWFDNPNAPKYPGVDLEHPTPFMRSLMQPAPAKEKAAPKPAFRKPPILFAPDCLYSNHKYYLYFCMWDDSEGVAVSDRPEGPFTNPVRIPVGGIDPAIFIDQDGTPYYYWSQFSASGMRLMPDMVTPVEGSRRDGLVTEEEHFFHEGSSMRRIGDTYYYVYADMERGKPTALGYATSDSPMGPFAYRGIIIDNDHCDPETWNNHGSIECFQGQWYVFYHRSSRGTRLHRRLCVEKIQILPDGTIPEVKMTSQGVGAPFAPGETIFGFQACEVYGNCRIDVGGPYEEQLCGFSSGDEAVFRYVQTDAGYSRADIQASGSGVIQVLLDGQEAGTIRIVNGKQLQSKVQAEAGEYELRLRILSCESLAIQSVTLS